MDFHLEEKVSDRSLVAASSTKLSLRGLATTGRQHDNGDIRLPPPSAKRIAASLNDRAFDLHEFLQRPRCDGETVLYLAYGSNLSNETFRKSRGIKPLAQVNVQVPLLRMTFDLPGIPYIEPCFANTARRDPKNDPPAQAEGRDVHDEKVQLLAQSERQQDYRKDRWHKGLIGVVYEVTPEDYAHIIATEGGGASYHDILIDCHPLVDADPSQPVLQNPILPPFKAHTLFAPATPPDEDLPSDGGRFQRPDMGYAQASARYLKLITDGAAEHGIPYEYQNYLHSLRPYRITTMRQRMGQVAFLTIWVPIVGFVFGLGKIFGDEHGLMPKWLRQLTGAVFKAAWISYDMVYKPAFGDGERTITDGNEELDRKVVKQPTKPPNNNLADDHVRSDVAKVEHAEELV